MHGYTLTLDRALRVAHVVAAEPVQRRLCTQPTTQELATAARINARCSGELLELL
jgi:hypothetical protein